MKNKKPKKPKKKINSAKPFVRNKSDDEVLFVGLDLYRKLKEKKEI